MRGKGRIKKTNKTKIIIKKVVVAVINYQNKSELSVRMNGMMMPLQNIGPVSEQHRLILTDTDRCYC